MTRGGKIPRWTGRTKRQLPPGASPVSLSGANAGPTPQAEPGTTALLSDPCNSQSPVASRSATNLSSHTVTLHHPTASPTALSQHVPINQDALEPRVVPPNSIPTQNKRTAGKAAGKSSWPGLKMLSGVLESSAGAFGPLKSTVGGLKRCIDIYEVCILYSHRLGSPNSVM